MTALYSLFRTLLPYLVAISLFCGWTFASYRFGVHVEGQARAAEVAGLNMQHSGELSLLSTAYLKGLADAQHGVLDAEKRGADDMAALDLKYTKDIQNEKDKSTRDIAAVRSGAWRVRDQFTCALAGTGGTSGAEGAPGTSASMGDVPAGGGLRAEDAAEIIGESDRADAVVRQLSACQAIVARDRSAR